MEDTRFKNQKDGPIFRIKRSLRVLVIIFLPVYSLTVTACAEQWKEKAGEHFIVYYMQDDAFAKDVLDNAEVYYRRIATELGYPRYSDFWLWDKRVKIYIHNDRNSYLKATDMPAWSEGMADYIEKEIVSYAWSKDFIESLLPHEMAHLIFRDFVGFKSEVPIWLDEGVAQWAEEKKRAEMKRMVLEVYNNDSLLLLSDLMKLNINALKEIDRVYVRPTITKKGEQGVVFLSTEHLVTTYYLVSVSLVGFLIEKYGSKRFAGFCRELRDGKGLEDALKSAYFEYIRSLEELEERWREYLAKGCK